MSLGWVIFHIRILRFRVKRISRQFAFFSWDWRFWSNRTLLLAFIILIVFRKWITFLRLIFIIPVLPWFDLAYLPTPEWKIIIRLPKSSTVIIEFILPIFFFWFLTSVKWVLSKFELSGKWIIFAFVVFWKRIGYFRCIWGNRFIEFQYCFCNFIWVFKSIKALLFWSLILFLYALLFFYLSWIWIRIRFLLFGFFESWKIVGVRLAFFFKRIEKIIWLLWLLVPNLSILSGIHRHLTYIFIFNFPKKIWIWIWIGFKLTERCIIIFFLLVIFWFLKI